MSTITSVQEIPAVFAEAPDTRVSSKYTFIPTTRIIDDLKVFGWYPRVMSGSKTNPTSKHMIRFARDGFVAAEITPEIVLLNSHNGLCSLNLKAGLYRLVCSNGLIVATSVFDDIRIKHIHYSLSEVSRAVERFASGIEGVMASVEQMQRSFLSPEAKHTFAEEAVKLRWDHATVPIDLTRLLQPRRAEDDGVSVWNVMNILQEKLLNGHVFDIHGRRMRGLTQVESVVRFNQELYSLAMTYARN